MGSLNEDNSKEYFDDLSKQVFQAASDGNAAVLIDILQQMKDSERTVAIETCRQLPNFNERQSTPLIVAVKNKKILLRYKADMEGRGKTDFYGTFTPLFIAASNGRLDVLNCLVENGADVNPRTNNNWTPLMITSKYGHVNILKFLVEHGANLDIQDRGQHGAAPCH